jgi:hypothetical protein
MTPTLSSASCIFLEPPQRAARADAVFTGRVSRLDQKPSYSDFPNSIDPKFRVFQAILRVKTVFKGRVFETQSVGNSGGTSNEFQFEIGRTYTVFAYREGEFLTTSDCSGNISGPIDPGEFGLADGDAPTPGVGPGIPTRPSWVWALGLGLAVIPAALALAIGLLMYKSYVWIRRGPNEP